MLSGQVNARSFNLTFLGYAEAYRHRKENLLKDLLACASRLLTQICKAENLPEHLPVST